jgi:hypothetical protein
MAFGPMNVCASCHATELLRSVISRDKMTSAAVTHLWGSIIPLVGNLMEQKPQCFDEISGVAILVPFVSSK